MTTRRVQIFCLLGLVLCCLGTIRARAADQCTDLVCQKLQDIEMAAKIDFREYKTNPNEGADLTTPDAKMTCQMNTWANNVSTYMCYAQVPYENAQSWYASVLAAMQRLEPTWRFEVRSPDNDHFVDAGPEGCEIPPNNGPYLGQCPMHLQAVKQGDGAMKLHFWMNSLSSPYLFHRPPEMARKAAPRAGGANANSAATANTAAPAASANSAPVAAGNTAPAAATNAAVAASANSAPAAANAAPVAGANTARPSAANTTAPSAAAAAKRTPPAPAANSAPTAAVTNTAERTPVPRTTAGMAVGDCDEFCRNFKRVFGARVNGFDEVRSAKTNESSATVKLEGATDCRVSRGTKPHSSDEGLQYVCYWTEPSNASAKTRFIDLASRVQRLLPAGWAGRQEDETDDLTGAKITTWSAAEPGGKHEVRIYVSGEAVSLHINAWI